MERLCNRWRPAPWITKETAEETYDGTDADHLYRFLLPREKQPRENDLFHGCLYESILIMPGQQVPAGLFLFPGQADS